MLFHFFSKIALFLYLLLQVISYFDLYSIFYYNLHLEILVKFETIVF